MIYLSGDGLNKVDFKVESGDVKALSHMSGTVPHALSTSYFWARAEVELEPGRYDFTNCGFVAGGEYVKIQKRDSGYMLDRDDILGESHV